MANTVIQLKYSSTPSSVPTSLANGELAINYADGKLYYKNATGVIVSFSAAASGISFGTINANNSLVVAGGPSSILTLKNGDNIEITSDIINDIITFTANLKPAFDVANAAFGYANTLSTGGGDVPAGTIANAAFVKANAAYTVANSAFGKANNALANTTGTVFNGNLTISQDLTISNNITTVNSIFFNTNSNLTGIVKGQISWNDDDQTFNLGMAEGSVLQVGQEAYYRVINTTESTINDGTVVMATGVNGASKRITVAPAVSDGTVLSRYVLGVCTNTLPPGQEGYVTQFGNVRGLDTTMFNEGDALYANVSVPGAFQNTEPKAPYPKNLIAYVLRKDSTTGEIFVRVSNSPNLGEDQLVNLDGLANGHVLTYVSANGRFENSNVLVSAYGVANAAFNNANSTLILAQAAFDRANLSNDVLYVAASFNTANAAYDKANAANLLAYNTGIGANNYAGVMANSANAYAASLTPDLTPAFNKANNAYIVANAAFDSANLVGGYANTAGSYANQAGVIANSSFGSANTVGGYANTAGIIANAAFGAANQAGVIANSAFGIANVGYDATNSAFGVINAVFTQSNTDNVRLSSAYVTINAGYVVANAAFDKANAANVLAYNTGIGANNYAGAMANSANVFTGTVYTAVNSAFGVINASFASANTVGGYVNTVGGYANTAGSYANTSGLNANQAGVIANAAFGFANGVSTNTTAAFTVANAAFGKANTALQNTTGTFAGDLTVTGNVNAHILASSNGFVDLGPGSRPSYLEGRIYYDNVDKSLTVMNDTSEFPVPLGQKEFVRVWNSSGATISKGKPVYATGYHTIAHHHVTIALADASNASKYDVFGLAASDIADQSHGYVIVRGWIGGIDTSSLTAGQRFHLGFASPGSLVTVAPEYPNYPYDIGYCVVSDPTNGYLYIDRQSHTLEGLRVVGTARVGGDMTVEGDFTVLGTQVVTSTSSLAVGTQYIYLGVGDSIPNANITFTGTGLNDLSFKGHYEGTGTTNFWVKITEANVNGNYFSWSYDNFSTVEASNTLILYQTNQPLSNGISVFFQSNTGHTIGSKWNASATAVSVDAGFITNHTDPGKYTHAGLFRDASDATFKFFNTYDTEPAGNIDISNSTFTLANVQVLKITAEQIYAGATEIGSLIPVISLVANAAFDKANSANVLAYNTGIGANNYAGVMANGAGTIANSAFGAANQAGVIANAAFGSANTSGSYANQAGVIANSAFGSANGVGTSANTAGSYANQAGVIANSAFGSANTAGGNANQAGVIANSAFGFANGVSTNTTAAFGFANGVSTNTTAAFGFANGVSTNAAAAFGSANGVGTSANTAGSYANQAGVIANSAFGSANTSGTYANTAGSLANQAGVIANAAFGFANGVSTNTTAAFGFANGVSTNTTAAFGHSNLTYTAVNSAFVVINAAFTQSNTDNVRLSSAYVTVNAAFTQSNTDNVRLSSAYVTVNAAYGFANTINTYAYGVAVNAKAAFDYANGLAVGSASEAYAAANQAGVIANAAFDKANAGGGGASVNVGNVAPTSANVGNLWWNTDIGRMYVYYTDANSSQWVEASPTGIFGADSILANTDNVKATGSFQVNNNLFVANNIFASNTVYATHFDNVSDKSLKDNIEIIYNSEAVLSNLNPVSFTWKKDGTTSFGLIAQEVEKVLPEIVHKMGNIKTVNYIELIPFLISRINEQQKEINEIKSMLNKNA